MIRSRPRRGSAPIACVLSASLLAASSASAQVRAFGEAEGFGRFATGARTNLAAASIYHVTNLNDAGAGSFRDAVSASNRFVVFDVSGVVRLNSVLSVKSNITIAGQTAPGGGITLYGQKVSYTGADNTITRYLRMRKGNASGRDDALSVARGSNMMFDHMSVTWGVDETFSMNPDSGYTIDNISIQNTIIGQGLDVVNHSAGGLMTVGDGHFSVLRSLFADSDTRNPKVRGNNQFVNNVDYNWTTAAYIMGDTSAQSHANVVGNYFMEGPSNGGNPFTSGTSSFHIYQEGNYSDPNKNGVADGTLLVPGNYAGADVVTTPFDFPTVGTDTAQQALQRVLAQVGPSIYRDEVDTRIIQEVSSYGTIGQIVLREADLYPGYPGVLPSPARPLDTDNDAIPDAWESAHGLNPNDATDWKTLDVDGYTMLEEYVNGLVSSHADKVSTVANSTWTNANWAGGVPTWDEDAFVRGNGAGAAGNLIINAPGAQAMTLSVGGNGNAAGESVTVNAGGSLFVVDTLRLGAANRGTLTVNAGGSAEVGATVLGNAVGAQVGTLNVSGGTFKTARLVAATAGSAVNLTNNGTLAATGNFLFAAPINVGTGGGTLDSGNFDGTVSGVVSGAANLTKVGTGRLTLSAANTYTGVLRVNAGTLAVTALADAGTPGNLGAGTADPANLVLAGGTLEVLTSSATNRGLTVLQPGGTIKATANTLTISGDIVGGGSGSRTLTFDLGGSASNTSTVSGAIAENGSRTNVTKIGTGRLLWSGTPKAYIGNTFVNEGTLLAYATNIMPYGPGKGDVTVAAAGTLDVRQSQNINGLNGAGTITSGGAVRTLTLGNNNANGDFGGIIYAPLSVVKAGTGTQTLSGALSQYNGTTTINGGVLSVGALANGGLVSGMGAATNAAANLVLNGGTLRANGSTDRLFTLGVNGGTLDAATADLSFINAGDVAVTAGGSRTLTFNAGAAALNSHFAPGLADPVGGVTSFTKSGPGRVFLDAATRTYSGTTSVTGGTLQLVGADALPNGTGRGNVFIGDAATLNMGNNSQLMGGLSGTALATLAQGGTNTRTLTLGDGGGAYAGTISGSPLMIVVKAGAGTQSLLGTNTWGGGTRVDGGTLIVGTLPANGAMNLTGGTLSFTAKPTAGAIAAVLPSLAVDASDARLDLTNNAFVIDYANVSPLVQVRTLLRAGLTGGTGIVDSTADATHRIGYLDTATLAHAGADATSVYLVRAIVGDANLDGAVDFDDLLALAQNYGQITGGTWLTGDFDYNAAVDFDDLLALAQHYGAGTGLSESAASFASDWALARSLVPEPATLAAAVVTASIVSVRRRAH